MGLYDTFILNTNVICSKCGKDLGNDFQTKELDESMANFYQGQIAGYYRYRLETEEERTAKLERFRKENPNWFDANGKLLPRFAMFESFGMLKKTDELVGVVPDGVYATYTWCNNCKELKYLDMVVFNKIFLGIYGRDDSLWKKIKAKFRLRKK